MTVEELVKGYRSETDSYCDNMSCIDCYYEAGFGHCKKILLYSMLLAERKKVEQLTELIKNNGLKYDESNKS